MNNPIASAIKQICDEKSIPQEQVIEALEAALAAAFRKDFADKNQNVKCEFDIKTGDFRFYDVKKVVEDVVLEEEGEVEEIDEGMQTTADEASESADGEEGVEEKKHFNPKTDIMLSIAREAYPNSEVGEEIRTELTAPADFGRMAAQTAKQVIIQKIREAERTTLFEQFKDREGSLLIGTVQRREEMRVLVDFGKVTAFMPIQEQIPRERYMAGDRIKVYVISVQLTTKGPEIIVSRAHGEFVKRVFESEIPEVANGSIEIMGVSREPGHRSKVAVRSHSEMIDPIGSCIGQRGGRIQTIIAELGGEKVDIILYDEDPAVFIANALSPAKTTSIELDEERRTARVVVPGDQLSLAIGRMGQNVRLASQLVEWNIDVVSSVTGEKVASNDEGDEKEEQVQTEAPPGEEGDSEESSNDEVVATDDKVQEQES